MVVFTMVKNGKLSTERGARLVSMKNHEFEALDKEHTMVVSRTKLNEMIRTERRLRWFNKVAKPKLMFAGCGILVGTVIVAMVRWLG